MKKINKQAFTLVELLIVVAILAVLATVGFVSYSNYLTGVRDTNRVTQLVGIRNAIETFKTTKDTPLPEEKIDIEVNGELIAYQGIVGQNILNQIGLSDGGTDPKDETYFPYYVTKDRKYFQLMTFLEDEPDKEEELTFFPQTYASTDYSIRYPKVIGFPLGILTEKDTNVPLHEIETLTGTLDVMTASGEYVAHIQDNNMVSGTGGKLIHGVVALKIEGKTYTSCKNILERVDIASGVDGVYTINPTGSESFQVYCDMTTDGGGWTLISVYDSSSSGNWEYSSASDLGEWDSNSTFGIENIEKPYQNIELKTLAYSQNIIQDFLFIRTTDKKEILRTNNCNVNKTMLSLFEEIAWGGDSPIPICPKSTVTLETSFSHTFYNSSAANSGHINYGALSIKVSDNINIINDDTAMITTANGDVGYMGGGIQSNGDGGGSKCGVSNGVGDWNNPVIADYGIVLFIR